MKKHKQNTLYVKNPDIETWAFVKGTNAGYSVSTHGRVRSNGRHLQISEARTKFIEEKFLSIHTRKNGYSSVDLGHRNTKLVHRLVAEAFIRNPMCKPCVNHKDGNPANNRASNLEWVTYAENERHSYDVLGKKGQKVSGLTGLLAYQSKPILAEFTDGTIRTYESSRQAEKELLKSADYLRCVCSGKYSGKNLTYKVRFISREDFVRINSQKDTH